MDKTFIKCEQRNVALLQSLGAVTDAYDDVRGGVDAILDDDTRRRLLDFPADFSVDQVRKQMDIVWQQQNGMQVAVVNGVEIGHVSRHAFRAQNAGDAFDVFLYNSEGAMGQKNAAWSDARSEDAGKVELERLAATALRDGTDCDLVRASVRKVPLMGKIWHIADHLAEAEQWKVDLLAKGATHVELNPERDRSIVDVIITLDRGRANEILGYEVGEEEWLDLSDDEPAKQPGSHVIGVKNDDANMWLVAPSDGNFAGEYPVVTTDIEQAAHFSCEDAERTIYDLMHLWPKEKFRVEPVGSEARKVQQSTNLTAEVSFAVARVGQVFVDVFDVGDTWVKINSHQAKLLSGRKFGPNEGGEGTVHEIDPTWKVQLSPVLEEKLLTEEDQALERAGDEGRFAHGKGVSSKDNPYPKEDQRHEWWNDGWEGGMYAASSQADMNAAASRDKEADRVDRELPGYWRKDSFSTKDGKPSIQWGRHGVAAVGEPSYVTHLTTYETQEELSKVWNDPASQPGKLMKKPLDELTDDELAERAEQALERQSQHRMALYDQDQRCALQHLRGVLTDLSVEEAGNVVRTPATLVREALNWPPQGPGQNVFHQFVDEARALVPSKYPEGDPFAVLLARLWRLDDEGLSSAEWTQWLLDAEKVRNEQAGQRKLTGRPDFNAMDDVALRKFIADNPAHVSEDDLAGSREELLATATLVFDRKLEDQPNQQQDRKERAILARLGSELCAAEAERSAPSPGM